MKKTRLFSSLLCASTIIGVCTPIISCGNSTNHSYAEIDPTKKAAKTNQEGLTYYPISLESPWDDQNQLSASVNITTQSPAYQIHVESVNPVKNEKQAYVVVKMVPGAGKTVVSGDTINFDIELTCSNSSQNSTLWSTKIQGLSAIWGDTGEDVDEDFDGLTASIDLDDHDNEYTGGVESSGVEMNFQFRMDYRDFFKVALGLDGQTKDKWHDNLAKFSTILVTHSSKPKQVTLEKNRVFDCMQLDGFYKQIGCKDYEQIILKSGDYTTDKNDVNVAEIAHHDMVNPYDTSKNFKIIFLAIRGSKNAEEWKSNFDVGAYDEYNDTNYLPEGKTIGEVHPDWFNKNNNKGFDVAANRLWKRIFDENGYCSKNGINLQTDNVILFTTGYSRGAGIANILGARFVDTYVTQHPDSIYNITYCHATPFTTDKRDFGDKYNSIHCIVNKDDFVGKLPFECWNLKKYGKIHLMPIGENEENVKKYNSEWKLRDPSITKEYVYYDFWLDRIDRLPVQNRYDMYKTLDSTDTLSNPYSTQEEAQEQVNNNKQTFKDLNISDRYINQEIKEEDEQFVIHTKVSLGAVYDIACDFFNGTKISISKLLSILPLFESYEAYVGKLALNIAVATLFGTNIMDVIKIDHSSTTYYFATANMPEDQKN